jgi:hypothetical protein
MTQFDMSAQPTPQGVRLIDFDRAEVRPGFVSGTYILIVTGSLPCINMDAGLVPVSYIRCPDYWRIEVVGSLPHGICLPAIGTLNVHLPLGGIVGSRGIEVVGATKSERIDVSGGCQGAAK